MIKPKKLGPCDDSLTAKVALINAMLEGEDAEEATIALGYFVAHQMSLFDYSVASKLYVFLTNVMSTSIEISAQENDTARYKFESPEDDEQ